MGEKYNCPICKEEIDIRQLLISKLEYDITKDTTILSLRFLFNGICPFCNKIFYKQRGNRKC